MQRYMRHLYSFEESERTRGAMQTYRFERFHKGNGANLRHSGKNTAFITVANVPGPLAFVEFVLDDDDEEEERANNFKSVKNIIVPEIINVRFIEQGLKIFRHACVKTKPFQSIVTKCIRCLDEKIGLCLSINVTFDSVQNLCYIAEERPITTDVESNEAKKILKLLLLQMLPERTEKLRLILKHCPTDKMDQYAKCNDVDWNPDLRDLTKPFNLRSMLSGDRKPTNDALKLALELSEKFNAVDNTLLAVFRNEINAKSVDTLVESCIAHYFYSLQDKSKCWVTTPSLFISLNQCWSASDSWNRFPLIDNWDKFQRGRTNLSKSCLVLCIDDDEKEDISNLVTADTLWNGSAALERLPRQPFTVILYRFDTWTLKHLLDFLPLFDNERIKDIISTHNGKLLPLEYTDIALSSKAVDVLRARNGINFRESVYQ